MRTVMRLNPRTNLLEPKRYWGRDLYYSLVVWPVGAVIGACLSTLVFLLMLGVLVGLEWSCPHR